MRQSVQALDAGPPLGTAGVLVRHSWPSRIVVENVASIAECKTIIEVFEEHGRRVRGRDLLVRQKVNHSHPQGGHRAALDGFDEEFVSSEIESMHLLQNYSVVYEVHM